MNDHNPFIVKPGSKVKLKEIDPDFTGKFKNKESAAEALAHNLERINELQKLLYAEHKQSLLICIQAMDGGGKDGTVKTLGGALNPQGCHVVSFKEPSKTELDHDYLWRAHRETPAKGDIAIFNRSYYEDVLIVRVHDLVPKEVWEKRYDQINNFEKMLTENGTHILKFFLHIDEEEQLQRFRDRIDNPAKNWKIAASDFTERERWDDYQKAYEDVLSKCSTPHAPWSVIPANNKWFRDLAISQIVMEYLENLKMKPPAAAVDIEDIKKKYFNGKPPRP